MNGISHKQAMKWIHLRLDGMLKEKQSLLLDEHLHACESCHAYANELGSLPTYLNREFKNRWDSDRGPSGQVAEQVSAKAKRIPMQHRFASSMKLVTGFAAVLFFVLLINLVISQMRGTTIAANGTENSGGVTPVSMKASNRLLAFTREVDGNLDIYTIRADGTELTNLTNSPEQEDNPYWSPDGKRIAFNRSINDQQQIFVMNADGSNVIQLTDDGGFNKLASFEEGRESGFDAWSPDGKKLVFIKGDLSQANNGKRFKLYVLDVETKTQTPLTNEWGLYRSPAWSPDGMHVAFTSIMVNEQNTPDQRSIQVADTDGNNLVDLTESLPGYLSPVFRYWSSDGQSIIFFAHDEWDHVYEARLDGSTIEYTNGRVRKLLDYWNGILLLQESVRPVLTWLHSETVSSLEICPNENISYTRSNMEKLFFGIQCSPGEWSLYLANKDGGTVQTLLGSPLQAGDGVMVDQAWSPDENYVAFNISSQAGRGEMFILDVVNTLTDPSIQPAKIDVGAVFSFADSLSWQPVLADEIVDEKPIVPSKNGLIAFMMEQDGNMDIYTLRTDGSALSNLTNNPGFDGSPVWSPDGKHLAFVSDRDGNENIYVMNADGSGLTRLTDDPGSDTGMAWSPDGTKISYTLRDLSTNIGNVYIMDADGQNHRRLTNNDSGNLWTQAWSPDGEYIFFYDNQQIVKINLDAGDITSVTSAGDVPYQFVLSTDGSHIVYLVGCGQNSTEFCNRVKTIHIDGTKEESYSSMEIQQVCSDPANSGQYYMTKWSPDRTKILFAFYCKENIASFYIADADGSDFKPLTAYPIPGSGGGFDWSPDSHSVVFTSSLNGEGESLYTFNVNDVLQNPELRPTQLNAAVTRPFFPVWQPVSHVTTDEVSKPGLTPTPLTVQETPAPAIGTNISNGDWIAFIGGRTVPEPGSSMAMTTDEDVFLIHPDGSGLVNITNSPDLYVWPQWSPNGEDLLFLRFTAVNNVDILRKNGSTSFEVLTTTMSFEPPFQYAWSPDSERIAFVDKRSGNHDIYTMYADGRDDPQITQLTDDPAQDFGFAWSPDGERIAFQRLDGDRLSIYIMNKDGSNQYQVAQGMGRVDLHWSQNENILYVSSAPPMTAESNWLDCEGCSHNPGIYRIDLGALSVEQIYVEPEYRQVSFLLYETPQNTLYFMRIEPQPFVEFWGTWFRFNGTSVQQLDPLDPHQTCEATGGTILSEDISPNQRFSIVSNFCGAVFDLYLADREDSQSALRHIIRLPLDTLGQGGDFAYLPMAWSPDGRWLVYDNGYGRMFLLDLENAIQDPTTLPVPLIQPTLDEGQSSIFVADMVWQPKP